MGTINKKNGGVMRIIRLVAGIGIIWSAFADQQPWLGFVGGFLLLQVVTNTGCGAVGCGVSISRRSTPNEARKVEYDEVR
nr:hypothetical protein A6C57_03375 [Fibrella sp. ES10-3-2-2]